MIVAAQYRKQHMTGGAVSGFAGNCDGPPMCMDDPQRRRQADVRALDHFPLGNGSRTRARASAFRPRPLSETSSQT